MAQQHSPGNRKLRTVACSLWSMIGTTSGAPIAEGLGEVLRRLREETPGRPSVRAVAAELGWGHATLSRFETGTRLASREHVERLLTLYVSKGLELDERTRNGLLDATGGREATPWIATSVPEQRLQLDTLIRFEQSATKITDWSPLLVPGLCQTQEYARAIMRRADVPADEVETRVAVRGGRQHAWARRDNPVQLLALIGEGVLRHRIGGPRVMAGQLRFLLELAERPNVTMQIVPEATDWHPGLEGPFVLAEFGDRTPVVHLEIRGSGLFFHLAKDVGLYADAAQMVLHEAMSQHESMQLIACEAEQIEETIR